MGDQERLNEKVWKFLKDGVLKDVYLEEEPKEKSQSQTLKCNGKGILLRGAKGTLSPQYFNKTESLDYCFGITYDNKEKYYIYEREKSGSGDWKDEPKEFGKREDFESEILNLLEVSKVKEEIKNLIRNGATQIILTGAPGTGKTYMAKEIVKDIIGKELIDEGVALEDTTGKKKLREEIEKRCVLVQFHPSYDYTDFVEGLRPIERGGKVTFKKVDGIFKEFCRNVVEENEKEKKYFFIIDEINRADLSKVFGELMYGLETDKRGEANHFKTQYQNLKTYDVKKEKDISRENDVFAKEFYIPENVYIIGTMNDIDRSVESMDFALRRRFLWKEIKVDEGMLKNGLNGIIIREEWFKDKKNREDIINNVVDTVTERIKVLNGIIEKKSGLGAQYDISQGQFANLPQNVIDCLEPEDGKKISPEKIKEFLSNVWDLRIESLLYEYVRGEEDAESFVKECRDALIEESDNGTKTNENGTVD